MKRSRVCGPRTASAAALAILACTLLTGRAAGQPPAGQKPAADERATKPDSFYYYGPGGLWKQWHDPKNPDAAAQRLGRDTWIHWTWGNQKFLRRVAVLGGGLSVPVSVDFFRVLDSRNRGTRFRDLGLINEPNCERNDQPDQYGLYLDKWKGDPLGYYPGAAKYKQDYPLTYPGTDEKVSERHYGRPTGVAGLRLFDNPRFKEKEKANWSVDKYFANPGKVEPPYLVGFSCAFCHIAFDPTNPPKDPENPRWENLAANIGNQYLREGELFLGQGRLIFGDKHPDPAAPKDPYRTRGLSEPDFLYHYAVNQQRGTSETSRISYDFIDNPNTMNPIYNLRYRPTVEETAPNGQRRQVMHILKDGADSIGLKWAVMRVPINIGCEGEYWIDRLFDPVNGRRQRPFRIAEVMAAFPDAERKRIQQEAGNNFAEVPPERLQQDKLSFSSPYAQENEKFGDDWREGWRRADGLAAYLMSYGPAHLGDAVNAGNDPDARAAAAALPADDEHLTHGKELFARHCATCHSSKQPDETKVKTEQDRADFFRQSVLARDFLDKNFLSDDRRYPVTLKGLGTNMARALATNAIDGDIWAEFSSKDYKALPPVGRVTLDVPVFPPQAPLPWSVKKPIRIDFEPPGGGRGYYRSPSLVSMWATAPYLHNNSVGDYYVVADDGTRTFFPNAGARIGRRLGDGSWVDYRIDVSVEGRLKMFEDGVDKLLNPSKRRRWVKRTSADSTLIPDLENAVPQFILAVTRDVARKELGKWLKDQQVPDEVADEALQVVDGILAKIVPTVLPDAKVSLRFGWAALQLRLRDHSDRLFDLAFDQLKTSLPDKLAQRKLPLDKLKPALRAAFLDRLDQVDKDLQTAAVLQIPAGTPVNLYANLNASALLYAALAHVRNRGDPRGLAEALLKLSDCPDLVEDAGHTFGSDLSDADKKDLTAFLKTL